ncbi:phosphatidylserine decarboxylase-domain-containing protein [Mycena capillaripes]|nr:phosphatidylserine decarboxylase-domain-containing protein [Mycena capillaripes]
MHQIILARRLLKSLSIKQGIKYDSTESARDIPTPIEFHGLKVDEILDPLDSFKTFDQFFYRKLKPSARPTEPPDHPLSAADCPFGSVSEMRLWIKGHGLTIALLLGDAYKHGAERYMSTGGALAIFRLAPQDYHRFTRPSTPSSAIGRTSLRSTIPSMCILLPFSLRPRAELSPASLLQPQAIRTALDVYGENACKIVLIDSPQFGRVVALKEGDNVKRGQEFGCFALGGSTIVLVFERDVMERDEDLLVNGRASLKTLVRVGTSGMRKPGR